MPLTARPRLTHRQAPAYEARGFRFGRRLSGRGRLRFASEPRSLRERRSLGRIVRCYHRVVWLQSPLFAVFVRSQPIVNRKMTFQRFEFLPLFQADDVVRRYRPFRIDGGFLPSRLGHIRLTKARKRRMDRRDEVWQPSDGQGVLADIGRDNVCRQPDQISRHGFVLITQVLLLVWGQIRIPHFRYIAILSDAEINPPAASFPLRPKHISMLVRA